MGEQLIDGGCAKIRGHRIAQLGENDPRERGRRPFQPAVLDESIASRVAVIALVFDPSWKWRSERRSGRRRLHGPGTSHPGNAARKDAVGAEHDRRHGGTLCCCRTESIQPSSDSAPVLPMSPAPASKAETAMRVRCCISFEIVYRNRRHDSARRLRGRIRALLARPGDVLGRGGPGHRLEQTVGRDDRSPPFPLSTSGFAAEC